MVEASPDHPYEDACGCRLQKWQKHGGWQIIVIFATPLLFGGFVFIAVDLCVV